MPLVPLPILDVSPCKFFRPEHEKVFSVVPLYGLRKIEAAGDDNFRLMTMNL
jgi:hypothetical protein